MMGFGLKTLCMTVPWKVFSLLEQGAVLEALLQGTILPSILPRHKGQFPGSIVKYNTCSLSVCAITYVNKVLPSLQTFFYVINIVPQFPFERLMRGKIKV
jgi:hypothetical protein